MHLRQVGKISKLYGRQGAVTVNFFEDLSEHDIGEPLFVIFDGLEVPLYISEYERKGIQGAVITFEDFDTVERSTELLGKAVFLANTDNQPDTADENPGCDPLSLVGFECTIIEHNSAIRSSVNSGPVRGRIADVIVNPLNPLFVVKTPCGEVLIPVIADFIAGVDIEKRTVSFDVPEGMTSL